MLLQISTMMLAQTPAAEFSIDPAQPWWVSALQAAATLLGGLFVWLLKSYGGKLVSLITEKTGNPFIGEITQRSLVAVLSFYQTEVKHLQRTAQWDAAAKERLKKNGIDHLKMLLDPAKLAAAAGQMGVDDFLGMHLEAAVATAKGLSMRVVHPAKQAEEVLPPDPTKE